MYLAVKFYGQEQNPAGLPAEWPSQVIEIHEGQESPDGYADMTLKELEQYKSERQDSYDDWKERVHVPADRDRQEKEFLLSKMRPTTEMLEALMAAGEQLNPREINFVKRHNKIKEDLRKSNG